MVLKVKVRVKVKVHVQVTVYVRLGFLTRDDDDSVYHSSYQLMTTLLSK